MILLCMDGLDSRYVAELNLCMPYEATPQIEPDLCISFGKDLSPHTLHVWPSMFTGRVVHHPDVEKLNVSTNRRRVRELLHRVGIRWRRKGKQVYGQKPKENQIKGILYNKCVDPKDTVFGSYNSFLYQVPGLVDNFLLGGTDEWYHYEHRVWGVLAKLADKLPYDLAALYTRQPDHLGHKLRSPAAVYREPFMIAKKLKCDVMILSDHGCDYHTGSHTMNGYIGANFHFKAASMLNVRKVIEARMSEQRGN